MNKFIYIVISLLVLTSCKKNRYDSQSYVNKSQTEENLINANRALVKKDRQTIIGVGERNNWDITETGTGMWYEMLVKGSEPNVQEGMIITLNYEVSLLDGTVCYTSEELGAKIFEVGHGGVESGLEQGVLFCSLGSKARLILPPYLAYGLPGDGDRIPARSIIVYEIEVVNLTNKK